MTVARETEKWRKADQNKRHAGLFGIERIFNKRQFSVMSRWGDSFSRQAGLSVTLALSSLRRHSIITLPNRTFSAGSLLFLFALSLHSLLLPRRRLLPSCPATNTNPWNGRRSASGTLLSSSSRRRTTSTGSLARLCLSTIQLYCLLMLVWFSFPICLGFGSTENMELVSFQIYCWGSQQRLTRAGCKFVLHAHFV